MREYVLCGPQMTFRANLGVKEIDLVEFVHLLQEDEGENCVWPETSVIRSKTLPQTEESFLPHDRRQYILQKEKKRVKKNEREGGWMCQRHGKRTERVVSAKCHIAALQ